ncbi:MAG: FAD-dependent monooxygenase, partial [Gammaproteobacteria bacterium]|nr:FAD-dependent monooxygenase [Gammaproteobacteria bacterium]
MDHCDVLVVGAGPAGSSLAWSLRNSDLDTMIIDRSQFPRTKVCAGWITPSVIDTLEIDINDYSNKHIIQPVNGFRISLMGTEQVEIRYPG